jgi:UDP:flavonoid glycosyltransferase YjiC (YdhE family)
VSCGGRDSNVAPVARARQECDYANEKEYSNLKRDSLMHLFLSALGSYGDVLPMVGLGATARARGHRVQVMANPYFQPVVEGAGLEMLPLGTADEYRKLMKHPDLWHPQRGLRLVLSQGAAAYLRDAYQIVRGSYRVGDTVIAAHGLDLASRVLHDKCRVPLATVHFAPFAIMTLHETPRYIGVPNMDYWPRWLKRAVFWAGDRFLADPIVTPKLNALRAEEGLPPVRRIYTCWNNSPDLVLALFPDWFGQPQSDWPANARTVGFPLWDPIATHQWNEEVEGFLNAGTPPIVFAPGSANVQANSFFKTAVEVCQRFGRRGMLMTKYPEQLPTNLPGGVRQFGFVPFSLLLPRACALVHHGGIGTCAQGLAGGLPQIVMPMAYDQLDNGLRLKRLGVGDVVPRNRFKPAKVLNVLEPLLESAAVAERCRELAARCDGPAALAAACDQLEQLHVRRRGSSTEQTSGPAVQSAFPAEA